MEEKGTCVLCGEEYDNYGNNPEPLAHEGRCCRRCNEKVIEARVEAMKAQKQKEDAEQARNGMSGLRDLDVTEATHIGFAAYMALSEAVLRDKSLKAIASMSTAIAERWIRKMVPDNRIEASGLEGDVKATAKAIANTTLMLIMMSDEDCAATKDMRELLRNSEVGGDAE